MWKKIFIVATVSLLLFVSFGMSSSGESESLDNIPLPCVYPCEIADVDVGETVTLCVVVDRHVENLYGFDIVFMWDTAVIEYVSHTVTAPVESYSEGILHGPTLSLKDEVDSAAGSYWVACSSMYPAEPFNGNGVVFTITFEVLSLSDERPFQLVSAMLSDDEGQAIDYSDIEKSPPEMVDERREQIRKQSIRDAYGFKKWWLEVVRPVSPLPHPSIHP